MKLFWLSDVRQTFKLQEYRFWHPKTDPLQTNRCVFFFFFKSFYLVAQKRYSWSLNACQTSNIETVLSRSNENQMFKQGSETKLVFWINNVFLIYSSRNALLLLAPVSCFQWWSDINKLHGQECNLLYRQTLEKRRLEEVQRCGEWSQPWSRRWLVQPGPRPPHQKAASSTFLKPLLIISILLFFLF